MPINILMPALSPTMEKGTMAVAIIATSLLLVTWPTSAQIYTVAGIGQKDLAKKTAQEQMGVLAGLIKQANQGTCAPISVALKSISNEGSGRWVVRCENKRDFFVLVPLDGAKGGVVLPCVMAKQAGQDCYGGNS